MNTCPICGSEECNILFSSANRHGRHVLKPNTTFQIGVCEECGLMGPVNVTVNREYYQTYYPQGYHGSATPQNALFQIWGWVTQKLLRNKIRLILKYVRPNRQRIKLLDIGCGTGNFLSQLDENLFDTHGLEPVAEAVASAKKRGINVLHGNVPLTPIGQAEYDVVTLWHVLEHIDQPDQALSRIHAALAPEGILVISTPNTRSLACTHGREFWFHLDAPRHLHLFNENNLARLLEKTGFTIVHSAFLPFDYPLDLFWSVRRKWQLWPLLAIYAIAKQFDKQNMIVIARKLH